MIQLSTIAVEEKQAEKADWKSLLSQSRLSLSELLNKVSLKSHPLANENASKLFEVRAPQPYLDKIKQGDPNDPLLLQILPQSAELNEVEGFTIDPLEEENFTPAKGLIHKYQSRVLLITSQACVINCRYCFRRNFPYDAHRQSKQDWLGAIDYIRKQTEVNEVILSGGDPLTNSNEYLFWLIQELDSIPSVKRIRIHTRLISTLPQRIDASFLKQVKALSTPLIIVMHCNHPNELGKDVREAIHALKESGVTLLNQSVLLRHINDKAEVLAELNEKLFEAGVLPYYLFILDKVKGAAHFDLSMREAKAVYKKLQRLLPGFLLPKLAVEKPGEVSKTILGAH